jgi:hypothetical protein
MPKAVTQSVAVFMSKTSIGPNLAHFLDDCQQNMEFYNSRLFIRCPNIIASPEDHLREGDLYGRIFYDLVYWTVVDVLSPCKEDWLLRCKWLSERQVRGECHVYLMVQAIWV